MTESQRNKTSPELERQINTLLHAVGRMKGLKAGQWTHEYPSYNTLIKSWKPEVAKQALEEVLACEEWFPSRATITRYALKAYWVFPSQPKCLYGLKELIRKYGMYGKKSKEHPGTFELGAPPMPEFVVSVVTNAGGWLRLCNTPEEYLVMTIEQAYNKTIELYCSDTSVLYPDRLPFVAGNIEGEEIPQRIKSEAT